MINLLPQEERREIVKDYRESILAVSLVLLLIASLVALALIFPSYLVLKLEEAEVKSDLENINKRIDWPELSLSQKRMKELNDRLAFLDKDVAASSTADLIKEILSQRAIGIKITNMSFAEGGVVLQGVAERRDSLLQFIKALKSSPLFREVDAPLSNLLSERNVSFSLNLK